MRVLFVAPSDKDWIDYYVKKQTGSGFIGIPYQRGSGLGSLFRGLFRFILPVAKKAGKAIGKRALKTGAEIASDLVAGDNLKKSVKRRGKRAVAEVLEKAVDSLKQEGNGLGKAPKKRGGTIKGMKNRQKQSKGRGRPPKQHNDHFGVYFK